MNDETIRETLTLLLQDEGYAVDKAETDQEAIEKSNSNFYNIAIVDWRLPDIEGTKLLGALKETTPKMVKNNVHGVSIVQNAIESVNNSADAFFVKPVDVTLLLE